MSRGRSLFVLSERNEEFLTVLACLEHELAFAGEPAESGVELFIVLELAHFLELLGVNSLCLIKSGPHESGIDANSFGVHRLSILISECN